MGIGIRWGLLLLLSLGGALWACAREPAAPQWALHDLAIVDLRAVPRTPQAGASVRIEARLENRGQSFAAAATVLLFHDRDRDGSAAPAESLGPAQSVDLLAAGESLELAFVVDSVPAEPMALILQVDAVDDSMGNNQAGILIESSSPHELRLHAINVGQGDALLIEFPSGNRVLIDAGDEDQGAAVFDYLAARELSWVHDVVLTHRDKDHFGGLLTMVELGFGFDRLWEGCRRRPRSGAGALADLQLLIRELVAAGEIDTFTAVCGDTIVAEEAGRLVVLGPARQANPEDCEDDEARNDLGIVCRLEVGEEFAALLLADVSASAEAELLAARPALLEAAVVKVPHHGSSLSSSAELVAGCGAQLALVSVGADNAYGHPSPDALERWAQAGAEVHRTDLEGSLVVITDGESLRLVTEEGP